jgi:hypothetical protein
MKSPSLDKLYAILNKHILLAQSYTEIDGLEFIIKSCRLKPYSYFFEDRDERIILHRHWFDEFGNSIKIDKNKRVRIVYGDLSLDQNKAVCTDLYHGLSMEKVAKMSKLAYLLAGKDEDLYEDCFFLTFLGIDNYLRCYTYLYNEWHQVSPLILGMKHLKNISKNADIKHFLELKNKDNMPVPCISVNEWITLMPPNAEFTAIIEKQHEVVSQFFRK